jgi:hypothetical protein
LVQVFIYLFIFSGKKLPLYPAPFEEVLLLEGCAIEAERLSQEVNLCIEHSYALGYFQFSCLLLLNREVKFLDFVAS